MGEKAFNGCALKSVNIPYGVTVIPDSCFSGCDFREITIPESVITIGETAIVTDSGLVVYCRPLPPPTVSEWAFGHLVLTGCIGTIYVPAESLDDYKAAWSSYQTKMVGVAFE